MTQKMPDPSSGGGQLNEFQARRLQVTCRYIDKLLGDIESILDSSASRTAFPRYFADVLPEQRRVIEEYVARLRARLVRVLDAQGIARERELIPASHAIAVALGAIDIQMEDLMPQHMRGYGDLPEAAAKELSGIVGQLRGLTAELDAYLRQTKLKRAKQV
jgi:hypothetical protein